MSSQNNVYRDVSYRDAPGCLKLTPTELVFQGDSSSSNLIIIPLKSIHQRQLSPSNYSKHLLILKLKQASPEGAQKIFTLQTRAALEQLQADVTARMEGKEPPSTVAAAAAAVAAAAAPVGAFATTGGAAHGKASRKSKRMDNHTMPVVGAVTATGKAPSGKMRRGTSKTAASTAAAMADSNNTAAKSTEPNNNNNNNRQIATPSRNMDATEQAATSGAVPFPPSSTHSSNARSISPVPPRSSSSSISPLSSTRGLRGKRGPSACGDGGLAVSSSTISEEKAALADNKRKGSNDSITEQSASSQAPAPEPETAPELDSYLVEATLVKEESDENGDDKSVDKEVFGDEEEALMVFAENAPPDTERKFQRNIVVAFFAVICLLVVIIGVGVGVGLTYLKSDSGSDSEQPVASTIAPAITTTPNSMITDIMQVFYILVIPSAGADAARRMLQEKIFDNDTIRADLAKATDMLAESFVPENDLDGEFVVIPATPLEFEWADCPADTVAGAAENADCYEVTASVQLSVMDFLNEEETESVLDGFLESMLEAIRDGDLQELISTMFPDAAYRVEPPKEETEEEETSVDEEDTGVDNATSSNVFDQEGTTNLPTEAPTTDVISVSNATMAPSNTTALPPSNFTMTPSNTTTTLNVTTWPPSNLTTISPTIIPNATTTESGPLMRNGVQMVYVLHKAEANFCGHDIQASRKCGGTLASVTSEEEWDLLMAFVDKCAAQQNVWIGGQRNDKKKIDGRGNCVDSWSWSDNSGNFSGFMCDKWKSGDPNNQRCNWDSSKNEDHVMLNKERLLVDKNGCFGNCAPKEWGILILPSDYGDATKYPTCEKRNFFDIDSC